MNLKVLILEALYGWMFQTTQELFQTLPLIFRSEMLITPSFYFTLFWISVDSLSPPPAIGLEGVPDIRKMVDV